MSHTPEQLLRASAYAEPPPALEQLVLERALELARRDALVSVTRRGTRELARALVVRAGRGWLRLYRLGPRRLILRLLEHRPAARPADTA